MKTPPKKVFIKENDEYVELEYDEFCKMKAKNAAIKQKHFIPVQACLLEVDEQNYKEFYRDRERYKHVREQDKKHGLLSVNMMIHCDNEEDYADISSSSDNDLESKTINKLMIEKLMFVLPQLSDRELHIIDLIYYKQLTHRDAAKELGISQPTFEYHKKNLLCKLRTLL